MIHTDPSKRHDFVLLFDVRNGNPNGDPDGDNAPRTDPETQHGLVTDVSLKRKVRDYVTLQLERPIFIQSQVALNTLITKAFRAIGYEPPEIVMADDDVIEWIEQSGPDGFSYEDEKLVYGGDATRASDIFAALREGVEDSAETKVLQEKLRRTANDLASAIRGRKPTREQRAKAQREMCTSYYDIRMFGAVLSTGLNAGQVRGPMQLTFARSIDPIYSLGLSITRQARTTTTRMRTGPTEMGRKHLVPYGLYRAHGFYSPALAKQTGVTEQDLSDFWQALSRMFEFDRSASRGEMAMREIWVFSHENGAGNAPAHKLFDRVKVSKGDGVEEPRQFADYQVELDQVDFPKGVTLTTLMD